MKRLTIVCSTLVVAVLLGSPAFAQHQMPGQSPGQPPMMGGGMMGQGAMGQGMLGMMCPMLHQMMGGRMDPGGMMGQMGGGPSDPKAMGRVLQMRGEMFKAMGEIMLKHGKLLEEGK